MTEEIPDLTVAPDKELEPLKFKVGDDIFEAYPRVGVRLIEDVMNPGGLVDLASMNPSEATREDLVRLMKEQHDYTGRLMNFLDAVLLPDSAERFAERLRSATEPIEMPQILNIIRYLVGKYSDRPTEPPSPSTNGHGGTGTSSTDGQPAGA